MNTLSRNEMIDLLAYIEQATAYELGDNILSVILKLRKAVKVNSAVIKPRNSTQIVGLIRAIRTLKQIGLKEAKDLVDAHTTWKNDAINNMTVRSSISDIFLEDIRPEEEIDMHDLRDILNRANATASINGTEIFY